MGYCDDPEHIIHRQTFKPNHAIDDLHEGDFCRTITMSKRKSPTIEESRRIVLQINHPEQSLLQLTCLLTKNIYKLKFFIKITV